MIRKPLVFVVGAGASNVRSLEGVWRIVENAAGPNDPINRNPEPSQIICTKTHYSNLAVNRPRATARNRR